MPALPAIPSPPTPAELATLPIATVSIDPATWFRISQFKSGEPYFGRSAGHRFDDPHPDPARRFGTCYIGASLEVAVTETLLHSDVAGSAVMPQRMRFPVSISAVASRHVVRFSGTRPLTLVDLTGRALKRLVGTSELTLTGHYLDPQRWSQALHGHPAAFDGLIYQSRHLNNQQAAVVFDRATRKLGRASYQQLMRHPEWPDVMDGLGIEYRYP